MALETTSQARARTEKPCILTAWESHERELRRWLLRQLRGDAALADDLLQLVFLKALRRGDFCEVDRARAWLFTTAKTTLIDHFRVQKTEVPVPDELSTQELEPPEPVLQLSQCLPRALSELSPEDAAIIRACDLGGQTQAAYAAENGLSVPGAKSRLQRARRKLAEHLTTACQVRRDEDGKVCCFTPRGEAV